MFEKEAEYLKAKKESKDKITKVIKAWSAREETLHDAGFQNGVKFAYNKANEWHFMKDGDLPKENKTCLLYLGDSFNPITGWIRNGIWYFEDDRDTDIWQTNVIAWKEIVPPELPKE